MRTDHLVLIARARWQVAFVLFLLAAFLSIWLMGASNTPPPLYCGNAPVEVDSTVAQRWARRDSLRLVPIRERYGAQVDVERGQRIFKNECVACHKLDKDMSGPGLKYAMLHGPSPTWWRAFLSAQDSLLQAKEPYTTELHAQWGSYPWRHERAGLSAEEINDLMAWVEYHEPRQRAVY